MTILDYQKPASLEEAYALLGKKNAVILGGGMWLRLQKRKRISCAIDLSALGLDQIEETEEGFRIGAYVTLRQIEVHPGLAAYSHGAITAAVDHIVGVQFRNLATVGGSVFGRFGFSDILTVFTALGASVELYHNGVMPMETFADSGIKGDIITHILLPKKSPDACVYLCHRNASTDFPVLNTTVCLRGKELACSVGSRPLRAVTAHTDRPEQTDEARRAYAEKIMENTVFSSNRRGSEEYRKALCKTLVRRALEIMDREE